MVVDKSIAEQFTNLMNEIESKIKSDGLKHKQEQQWIDKKKSIFTEALAALLKKEKINPDIFTLSIEDKDSVKSEIEESQKSVMNPSDTKVGDNPSTLSVAPPIFAKILLYLYYTRLYKNGQVVQEGSTIGDIKDRVFIAGWDKGLGSSFNPPNLQKMDIVVRTYYFTPHKPGNYTFQVDIPYHGFYTLRSFDGWDSKAASVKIYGQIFLNQYYSSPPIDYTHLFILEQNILRSDRIETTRREYYNTALGAGDPCFLFVIQRFLVVARGNDSYAELNFENGYGNYLPPPVVTAWRVV